MSLFEGLQDFDVTALGKNATPATGRPRDLPIVRIEPDPDNIRKSFDEAAVVQLAETIKADGLLQAITVRRNVHKKDYFLISYGERRFRAVCLLGHSTIAAVINDNFDPYRQAIENLQREELDPLDIADWIQKRREAGDSLAEIAKRLGKPKSYISEIAQLIHAPAPIREAFRSRRIPDVRTAYLLARRYQENPVGISSWLESDSPISRRVLTRACAKAEEQSQPTDAEPAAAPQVIGAWNSFAVHVEGRDGTMDLKPGELANQAIIQFEDGSQEAVALSKIRLKTWTVL